MKNRTPKRRLQRKEHVKQPLCAKKKWKEKIGEENMKKRIK